MEINTLTEQNMVDLFPELNSGNGGKPNFGGNSDTNVDLFNSADDTTTSAGDTTTVASSGDTTTSVGDTTTSAGDTTTLDPKNVDILGTDGKPKAGRKPKYDFEDATGYFADRIKTGKFIAVHDQDEQGNNVPFLPKSPEEFDEVIDLQINYQVEQKAKELEKKIYSQKSPAWQAVLKYSEMVDDPAEVLPFIQGVKTIESVSEINADEIDGAEQIVRVRMGQRGDSQDVIDEQIEALKTTDKLISTAQKYKPIILQQEKQELANLVRQKQQQDAQYQQLVGEIREGAIKAIEAPIAGKQKLKKDEMAIVYDLIAQPSAETKGYQIYNAIDELFENRDFETLKQIALLVKKKDAFLSYISASAADKTAADLQRKLRLAVDNKSSSGNGAGGDDGEPVVSINRQQYSSTPRFGR